MTIQSASDTKVQAAGSVTPKLIGLAVQGKDFK